MDRKKLAMEVIDAVEDLIAESNGELRIVINVKADNTATIDIIRKDGLVID